MTEPTTTSQSASSELDWLLTDLVARVAGAREAVLLSADGLLLSASKGMDRDRAERVSAIASGFSSLARGASRQLGASQVRQTVVEMDNVFLFVLAAGHGACLSLVADATCDVGLVAYEINRLVRQVGPHLSALPRHRRPMVRERPAEGA
ncbi:roadblock/LC7 domain-containing protein [Actinorugispora endophytica]|uniref:Putative regulator of Ras-like GTPase activity (Roadblock/LC7/MglB family) n=1 Tax=Actinorugispora endophytica TaxID=1605990 RepID=A0A4R6V465_9ACTN|nr:roadblock/LC7 domain-containing protein [Actinorugispora endophytica]TDQ53425.1 putative regulator of Ras-like GTPase activity (Roadblock/LC7/MglB family) [Actinorugispora endophytica]